MGFTAPGGDMGYVFEGGGVATATGQTKTHTLAKTNRKGNDGFINALTLLLGSSACAFKRHLVSVLFRRESICGP